MSALPNPTVVMCMHVYYLQIVLFTLLILLCKHVPSFHQLFLMQPRLPHPWPHSHLMHHAADLRLRPSLQILRPSIAKLNMVFMSRRQEIWTINALCSSTKQFTSAIECFAPSPSTSSMRFFLLLKRSRILGKSTVITNSIRSWRQQELVTLPYRGNERHGWCVTNHWVGIKTANGWDGIDVVIIKDAFHISIGVLTMLALQ